MCTFASLVGEIRAIAFKDACESGLTEDGRPLAEGGSGATAYADAIATYIGFGIDRAADYGSSLATWLTDDNAIRGTFGRQSIAMTWDFCEGNFFGNSSAALETIYKTITNVVSHQKSRKSARIFLHDAAHLQKNMDNLMICTDPPYYDNVAYADLSDFFYIWLRRSIADFWPDLFRRVLTPKDSELVADAYRHGGKFEAEQFFMKGMLDALRNISKIAKSDNPTVIYYAFKQSDKVGPDTASAGWAAFLEAVVEAGFAIHGTWPYALKVQAGWW